MNTATTSTNCQVKRTVSFGSVTVRSFPRILGDNPSCSMGLPLTIGWKPVHTKTLPLNRYESLRSVRRRSKEELMLSADKRMAMAKQLGYTAQEISLLCVELLQAKRERQLSNFRRQATKTKGSTLQLLKRRVRTLVMVTVS